MSKKDNESEQFIEQAIQATDALMNKVQQGVDETQNLDIAAKLSSMAAQVSGALTKEMQQTIGETPDVEHTIANHHRRNLDKRDSRNYRHEAQYGQVGAASGPAKPKVPTGVRQPSAQTESSGRGRPGSTKMR